MLLQENGTRFCVDGKVFTVGGRVMANDASEYAGLCGTVTEIRSGADRETENDTPAAAADIFAKVLQMPDEDLRALRAFPVSPAKDEVAWEVVTEVCGLGGCDMRVYSFKDERSARVFAALLEHTGCRLRYDAACPSCYADYQKDSVRESEDF